jgi:hypothetical protein
MYAHYFDLSLPEARQWLRKAIPQSRFHINTDWPELECVRWHHNQCIKMRLRGFSA